VQHHDDTLAAFVAQESARDDAVAVVVAGSVARGTPRPDSDVDVYLVVTEERFGTAWDVEPLSDSITALGGLRERSLSPRRAPRDREHDLL